MSAMRTFGLMKIGGAVWKIEQVNRNNLDDCDGVCICQTNTILLDNSMSDYEKGATLMHEILHACAHYAGIEDKEKLTEEQYVTRISYILHDVFTENPDLFIS